MGNEQVLNIANRLEGILRGILHCNYNDFGVKANDNLFYDWQKPIYLALGYLYCKSGNSAETKDEIENFLEDFKGNGIVDILNNYEEYGFNDEETALNYVRSLIESLEVLFQSVPD